MPTYTVTLDITVSGVGKRTLEFPGIVAADIKAAIQAAVVNLVQTSVTGAYQTSPNP